MKTFVAFVLSVACLASHAHAQERVIQKASQSDVDNGTNDTRFVTPLKLDTRLDQIGVVPGPLTNNETRSITFSNNLTVDGVVTAGTFTTDGNLAAGGANISGVTASELFVGDGSGLTNLAAVPIKAPFSTNYTVTLLDAIICAAGTNQVITLPNITNTVPAGRIFTFLMSSTTGYGTAIITNANGVQTVVTAAGLSQTITNGQSLTLICDGNNWR